MVDRCSSVPGNVLALRPSFAIVVPFALCDPIVQRPVTILSCVHLRQGSLFRADRALPQFLTAALPQYYSHRAYVRRTSGNDKMLTHMTSDTLPSLTADTRRALAEGMAQLRSLLEGPSTPERIVEARRLVREFAVKAEVVESRGDTIPLLTSPAALQRLRDYIAHALSSLKLEEFNLTPLLTPNATFPTARGWSEQRVLLAGGRLMIGGHFVMAGWQEPLMNAIADTLLAFCCNPTPRVLELGWGLGFSGRRLLRRASSYTVVEAHADLARLASQVTAEYDIPSRVIHARWQDVDPTPYGPFDLVLFDCFPATYQGADYLGDVVRTVLPWLGPSAVFSYVFGNRPEQIPTLLCLGFSSVHCSRVTKLTVPPDWGDQLDEDFLVIVAQK